MRVCPRASVHPCCSSSSGVSILCWPCVDSEARAPPLLSSARLPLPCCRMCLNPPPPPPCQLSCCAWVPCTPAWLWCTQENTRLTPCLPLCPLPPAACPWRCAAGRACGRGGEARHAPAAGASDAGVPGQAGLGLGLPEAVQVRGSTVVHLACRTGYAKWGGPA